MIAAGGAYTVAIAASESFLIDLLSMAPAAQGTLAINGKLILGGMQAAMTVSSGLVALAGTITGGSVTINGGTLIDTGAGVVASAVALNAGTVSIASGQQLRLTGALTLGNGTAGSTSALVGPGTLLTTGTTTLADFSPFTGRGLISMDGGLTWANSGTVLDNGCDLFVDKFQPDSTLTDIFINQANGVFDIVGRGDGLFNNVANNAQNQFNNFGLLEMTAIGGSVVFVYAALNNTGSIAVAAGELNLDGGGTLGGTIITMAASAIVFAAGTFTLTGAFSNAGTLGLLGDASLGFSQVSVNVANLVDLTGGTLAIGSFHTITLTGAVSWGSGHVVGPGTLMTTGVTTLTEGGDIDGGLTWSNNGTVLANYGDFYVDNFRTDSTLTTVFINHTSGTFDIIFGYNYNLFYGISSKATTNFSNAGLLEMTGAGTASFDATLSSTGTVMVAAGTLDLNAGGTLSGALGASATGYLLLRGGKFLTSGTANILDDGSKTGLQIGSGVTWTDSGIINASGQLLLESNSGLTITAVGSFDFTTDDGGISNGGTGSSVTNGGTLAKIDGTGTSSIAVTITNTGTIDAASGTLKLAGLSGTGQLRIEAGKTLEIASGAAVGSNTIDFVGSGGTLKLDASSSVATPIIGLGAGSRIDLAAARSVTAMISGNTLTITPIGGTALKFVSTSSLANLHIGTASDGGIGTMVTLSMAVNTDAFSFSAPLGGAWGTAANWRDTTINAAATAAPGYGNAVSIAQLTAGFTNVTGSGAAASLAITGAVLVTGSIAVATKLKLAFDNNFMRPTTLALDSGAKLTAGSASLGGTLEAGHASSIAITGAATLTGSALLALSGSTVQLGALIGDGSGNSIAIDASSIIRIGYPNAAAAGALTQQTGTTTALTGAIYGSVVANGTLAVAAGGVLSIDMAGAAENDPYGTPSIGGVGVLSISEGSTLSLGVASSAAITFAGPNATLQLATVPTATITGFAAGDAIILDKTATALSYTQTTASSATLTLGTLKLAGNFSAAKFHLDSAADGSSATITVQSIGVAATQPTLIAGTAAADLLAATANDQTLTGLGGGDTLNGATFTGVDFKDLTGNLAGSVIQNFTTSDLIDFTDMNSAHANVSYSGGVLTAHDFSHGVTLLLGFLHTPASGSFTFAGDGASGTKVFWH